METTKDEIRQVTERYYNTFNQAVNGDPGAFLEFWSRGPDVVLMTAGGDTAVGWDAVRENIEDIPAAFSGHFTYRDLTISVMDDFAYTACVEQAEFSAAGEVRSADHRATHLFHREAGEWKVVLRHADVNPALAELIQRLRAA